MTLDTQNSVGTNPNDEYVFLGATKNGLICASIGGLLICLSSSLHLLTKGRITGMSGIMNGIITLDNSTLYWKISILLGMVFTSALTLLYFNENNRFFDDLETFRSGISVAGFAFAGFFTGFGTKLGNGCTSGHGVCGLPRFSIRSLVVVCSFMTSSIIVANIMNYFRSENELQFFTKSSTLEQTYSQKQGNSFETQLVMYTSLVMFIINVVYHQVKYQAASKVGDCFISFFVGVLFSLGLIISGMVNRRVVLGFLVFNSKWNPALALVLGLSVLPNILTFRLILAEKKPMYEQKFDIPNNKKIDSNLIVGGLIFGLGWGIGGMCPGPSFCMIPTMFSEVIFVFMLTQITGNYLSTLYVKSQTQAPAPKTK